MTFLRRNSRSCTLHDFDRAISLSFGHELYITTIDRRQITILRSAKGDVRIMLRSRGAVGTYTIEEARELFK